MEDGCGFFRWIDPPMCARSKAIIPGLLRRIREMERRLEELEDGGRMGWGSHDGGGRIGWGSHDDGGRMGWGFFWFFKPLCIVVSVVILFVCVKAGYGI